jgi:hypothetical protein
MWASSGTGEMSVAEGGGGGAEEARGVGHGRSIVRAMAAAKKAPAEDPAEALLRVQTPAARVLTERLRGLIHEVVPGVEEAVHMGWEVIVFGKTGKMSDSFVSLLHRVTYVNVQFVDGVDLPDPKGLLEGTGKRMRHVKVRSEEEAEAPAVRALIRAAARKSGMRAK